MSMNTELLQFLDGTLAPDREAELLHRLSVSPERRELLRSFINQQVLFQRDRNSIAVPYAAEQKLWARLGTLMPPAVQNAAVPAAAVIETAATTASRSGIFSSAFSVASVAVICLLIGLGSGYFAGKNSQTSSVEPTFNQQAQLVERTLSPFAEQTQSPITSSSFQNSTAKHNGSFAAQQSTTEAPLEVSDMTNRTDLTNEAINIEEHGANNAAYNGLANITSTIPKQNASNMNMADLRDPSAYYEHSPFSEPDAKIQKNFLQKWEFYFTEGIGKQFPNSAATNVSIPVVTNSSISAMYNPFANSSTILSNIWVGGSFGTANVTMKKFSIAQKDPLDPKKGRELVADLVHVQTTYGAALLQYRLPVSSKFAFTGTVTAASSSAGLITGGELGVHVDATNDVGFVLGLRGTHLSYNADAEQKQVIAQGISSFGVPASSLATQPSFNVEISSGIYFHF